MNTPQPSAEAIALAVKLSGHTSCAHALQGQLKDDQGSAMPPCDGCLGDAQTIDAELDLPARNAALLLAQTVADEAENDINLPICDTKSAIDELREALARIGKP